MTVRQTRITAPEMAFKIAALCNNSSIFKGKLIGDPTDGAMLKYAKKMGIKGKNWKKYIKEFLKYL